MVALPVGKVNLNRCAVFSYADIAAEIRKFFFDRNVYTPKMLAERVYCYISSKADTPKHFYSKILDMSKSHFQWFRQENSLRITSEQKRISLGIQRCLKNNYLKHSTRPIYKSSIAKLSHIVDGLVRYLLSKEGLIPVPVSLFRRLGAHASSNSKSLLHYLSIKQVLEDNGILCLQNNGEYHAGKCRVYLFNKEKAMEHLEEDDFIEVKKPKKHVVKPDDLYEEEVLNAKVQVTGEEVIAFAKSLEEKIRYYNRNRFINLVPISKRGQYKRYVLGAAICKQLEFDVDRFIEAQFYYHNAWKDSAPDLKYITSVMSNWSAIGRYHDYCKRFKRDICLEDQSKDNVEKSYKIDRSKNKLSMSDKDKIEYLNGKRLYEDMKERGLTDKYIFEDLGFPLLPARALPLGFLKTQVKWLSMLANKHWGEKVNKLFWESEDSKRIDI